MDNADSIKARIIAEFGNGPVTAEADTHLYANGNPIIPDVLCNAGGVIVSYLEMVQNLNMDHWEQDAVHSRLKMHITKTIAWCTTWPQATTYPFDVLRQWNLWWRR